MKQIALLLGLYGLLSAAPLSAEPVDCSQKIKTELLEVFDKRRMVEDLSRVFSFQPKMAIFSITLDNCESVPLKGRYYWIDDDPKKRPPLEAHLIAVTFTIKATPDATTYSLRSLVAELLYDLKGKPS